MHTKVKSYGRLRIVWHVGMMDKALLNYAAVCKGTKLCENMVNYIYGDCNKGGPIIGIGFW